MARTQKRLSEQQFMQQVIALARLGGWRVYHPWVSIRSAPGYPDLTLVKPGETLLFCELKTDTGTLTAAQADWIALLRQVQGCEVGPNPTLMSPAAKSPSAAVTGVSAK